MRVISRTLGAVVTTIAASVLLAPPGAQAAGPVDGKCKVERLPKQALSRQGRGSIVSFRCLGRLPKDFAPFQRPDEADLPGRYDYDVYYVEYLTRGGSEIAAQLAVPVGKAPRGGWPWAPALPQLGGLGKDFWMWPQADPPADYTDPDWTYTRHIATVNSYAKNGIAMMRIWYPGTGPSEPLATWDPFGFEQNLPAVADSFKAMRGLGPALDLSAKRYFLHANCVSSPTLVEFAERLATGRLSDIEPRALVADTFQPSIANTGYVRWNALRHLPGSVNVAGALALYAGPLWGLVEAQGYPVEEFFSPEAVDLFESELDTPIGKLPLIRGSILEPIPESQVAGPLYDAVKDAVGHDPTALEIRNWAASPELERWMDLPTQQEMIEDPWYRRYLAAYDPFFPENVRPFSPGIPVIAVALGGIPAWELGSSQMWEPNVQRLHGWGWDFRTHRDHTETTSVWGTGSPWAMRELLGILYRDDVPKRFQYRDGVHRVPAADFGATRSDGAWNLRSRVAGDDPQLKSQSWDLDGDGEIDDAAGPMAALPADSPGTVSLEVVEWDGTTSTSTRTLAVDGSSTPRLRITPVSRSIAPRQRLTLTARSGSKPASRVRWDLDGDGLFDDGRGARIESSFRRSGTKEVAAASAGSRASAEVVISAMGDGRTFGRRHPRPRADRVVGSRALGAP